MVVIGEISSSLIYMDGLGVLDYPNALILHLPPIKVQCVFATLRDNLFSSNNVSSDSKSSLTVLLMVKLDLEETEILVSSAYTLTFEALSFRGKSLM